MSILFYRRPEYLRKLSGPINATECARYVKRAKKSERQIPAGLSFDDVLSNKALSPCSLNDFMDYLVYIEHNAENLQFFLWFQDYTRRFNELPELERTNSPGWDNERDSLTALKDLEKVPKPGIKQKITAMKGGEHNEKGAALLSDDSLTTPGTIRGNANVVTQSIVTPSVSTLGAPSTTEATTQAGLRWQPFTNQPMRDEINRVMRHYLTFNSPRELNLSHRDRGLCLHALQHTTHPSALFPAFYATEAALRGQSHPNFIRWSIRNCNRPRVLFARTLGAGMIFLGFLLAIILTLSRASRWWRILAAMEWFLGISTLIAAYKGLCVILHKSHARNLRPWEHGFDEEVGDSRRTSDVSAVNRNVQMAARTGHFDDTDKEDREEANSVCPSSLKTFGPKNSFETANWLQEYEKRSLPNKVFDNHVWTQNETLRVLQNRIILGSNIWALILTFSLTIVFVALPKGNII